MPEENQNYLAKFQMVQTEIKSAIEKQQYGKCKLWLDLLIPQELPFCYYDLKLRYHMVEWCCVILLESYRTT